MFTNLFREYIDLSLALENDLINKTRKIKVSKNQIILRQGDVGKHLYLIESGIVMGYHTQKGKDICLYFSTEGKLFTSAYSLIRERPSFENIIALEDCVLYSLPRQDLYFMYEKFPEMNIAGRQLIEHYFLEIEERLNAIQFQDSKQRYRTF